MEDAIRKFWPSFGVVFTVLTFLAVWSWPISLPIIVAYLNPAPTWALVIMAGLSTFAACMAGAVSVQFFVDSCKMGMDDLISQYRIHRTLQQYYSRGAKIVFKFGLGLGIFIWYGPYSDMDWIIEVTMIITILANLLFYGLAGMVRKVADKK